MLHGTRAKTLSSVQTAIINERERERERERIMMAW
jgi:hypothetical protein